MPSNDENISEEALDRIRSWKDAGANVSFSLRGPSDGRWDIPVSVLGVSIESISFRWLVQIGVSGPGRPFATTDGTFVVWLEGTSVSPSDDRSSVLIARDPYRCVLKRA
jgi:hypothetical protein